MRVCISPLFLLLASFLEPSNAQEASLPNESSVRGENFYLESIDSTSKNTSYRNGASHRLVINGTKLVAVGSLDVASEDWKQIHATIENLRKTSGFNGLLHIQYFFERGTQPKRLRETKVATKIALADVDVYVACIDGHYRGDDATWNSNENEIGRSRKMSTEQSVDTKPTNNN